MVAAMLDALFERGLDAKAVDQSPYSHDRAVTLRVVTTVCACVSILADSLALVWFLQMKRKFRHSYVYNTNLHRYKPIDDRTGSS